jgi:hypothetical protein
MRQHQQHVRSVLFLSILCPFQAVAGKHPNSIPMDGREATSLIRSFKLPIWRNPFLVLLFKANMLD